MKFGVEALKNGGNAEPEADAEEQEKPAAGEKAAKPAKAAARKAAAGSGEVRRRPT